MTLYGLKEHFFFSKITLLLIPTTVIVLFLNTLFLFQGPRLWDPLQSYDLQKIVNSGSIKKSGVLAIPFFSVIKISGNRCADGDKSVQIIQDFVWATQNPAGTSIAYRGLPDVIASCSTNPTLIGVIGQPPQSVIDRSYEIKNQTGRYPIWIVYGTDTPYDENGNTGRVKAWKTENFILMPEKDYALLKK